MKARAEVCELSELCGLSLPLSPDEHPPVGGGRNEFLPLPSRAGKCQRPNPGI
jgi:hypothetical protein